MLLYISLSTVFYIDFNFTFSLAIMKRWQEYPQAVTTIIALSWNNDEYISIGRANRQERDLDFHFRQFSTIQGLIR